MGGVIKSQFVLVSTMRAARAWEVLSFIRFEGGIKEAG